MNKEIGDIILEEQQRLTRALRAKRKRKAKQLLNKIIYGNKNGRK